MTVIKEEKTTRREIEETETVTKTQCDVCECSWTEDEDMNFHDFCIDPGISATVNSLKDLDDLMTTYHAKFTEEQIEHGYTYNVPEQRLITTIREEMDLIGDRNAEWYDGPTNIIGEPGVYVKKPRDFRTGSEVVHHFGYKIDIESRSTIHKHVCEDCYDVVFE